MVTGKIIITYEGNAKPKVEIVGTISHRAVPNINRQVQIAYRSHMHELARKAKAEREERKVEIEEDDAPLFSGQEPQPTPDATLDITTQPTGPTTPQLELDEEKVEDLTDKQQPTSEDKEDGTDDEATRVRSDDEGQGRKGRPWEKQD
jgi:hypothetical protein